MVIGRIEGKCRANAMHDLTALETAAAALPPQEKRELLRFLVSRLDDVHEWKKARAAVMLQREENRATSAGIAS